MNFLIYLILASAPFALDALPTPASEATTTEETVTSEANRPTTSQAPLESTSLVYTSNEDTLTFSCSGRVTGYYADVKLGCRVYHFCSQLDDPTNGTKYERMSYLCSDDSYFDQKDLNCVKKSDLQVPCEEAEKEYEKSNRQFDPKEATEPSMSDNLAANIMMNPIARFLAGR